MEHVLPQIAEEREGSSDREESFQSETTTAVVEDRVQDVSSTDGSDDSTEVMLKSRKV